jgi:hypothetical protein
VQNIWRDRQNISHRSTYSNRNYSIDLWRCFVGSAAYTNIAIIILTVFEFTATTYGKNLAKLPDRIPNPAMAFGFGTIGLLATTILCSVSYLLFLVLTTVLHYLKIW